MTRNDKPMQFFKGQKVGVCIKPNEVERLLGAMRTLCQHAEIINDALGAYYEGTTDEAELDTVDLVETALSALAESCEELQLSASHTLADDIQISLDKYCVLSDETKAQALHMALGRLVAED